MLVVDEDIDTVESTALLFKLQGYIDSVVNDFVSAR